MSNEKIILLDLNVYSKISYAVDNDLINNSLIINNKKFISDKNLLEEINKIKSLDQEGFYISVIPSLVEYMKNLSTNECYFEQKEKLNKILSSFFKKAKHDVEFLDEINTIGYIANFKDSSEVKIKILEDVRQELKHIFQNKATLDRLKISQSIIKEIDKNQEKSKIFYLLLIILIYSKKDLIDGILKLFKEDQTYNSFNDIGLIEHYFLFLSFVGRKRFLMTGKKIDIDIFTFDKKLNEFFLLIKESVMERFNETLNSFFLLEKYKIMSFFNEKLPIPPSLKYGIVPEEIYTKIILTFNFKDSDFYNPNEIKEILEYF